MRIDLAYEADRFFSSPQRNPGSRRRVPDFLQHLKRAGVKFSERSQREWLNAADVIGMNDLERANFLEDVASWLD